MKKQHFSHILLSISLISLLSSCYSSKKEEVIGLNQNIHHDDFEYAVTSFNTTNLIVSENDTIRARGNFYLIHFRVINKALRVGHQWDNSIGFLIDENGNRYENIKDYQVALNKSLPFEWKEIYNTPHGQTDTTIFVFDLPINVRQPYLKVRGDILMGDALDGAKFKRIKVKLF